MSDHKLSKSGITLQTRLTADRSTELVRRAAEMTVVKANRNVLEPTRVVVTALPLPRIQLAVQVVRTGYLALQFDAVVTPEEYGSLIQTQITCYETHRLAYMGLIPLSPSVLAGSRTYEAFLHNLAATFTAEDSSTQAFLTHDGVHQQRLETPKFAASGDSGPTIGTHSSTQSPPPATEVAAHTPASPDQEPTSAFPTQPFPAAAGPHEDYRKQAMDFFNPSAATLPNGVADPRPLSPNPPTEQHPPARQHADQVDQPADPHGGEPLLLDLKPYLFLWIMAGAFVVFSLFSSSTVAWLVLAAASAAGGWFTYMRRTPWTPGVAELLVRYRLAPDRTGGSNGSRRAASTGLPEKPTSASLGSVSAAMRLIPPAALVLSAVQALLAVVRVVDARDLLVLIDLSSFLAAMNLLPILGPLWLMLASALMLVTGTIQLARRKLIGPTFIVLGLVLDLAARVWSFWMLYRLAQEALQLGSGDVIRAMFWPTLFAVLTAWLVLSPETRRWCSASAVDGRD